MINSLEKKLFTQTNSYDHQIFRVIAQLFITYIPANSGVKDFEMTQVVNLYSNAMVKGIMLRCYLFLMHVKRVSRSDAIYFSYTWEMGILLRRHLKKS